MALLLLALSAALASANWDKFFLIVFENKGYSSVRNSSAWAPFFENSIVLSNYYALTHPSQPNYLSLIGGSVFGVTSDQAVNLANTTIIDLLEAKNVSWKAYLEGYYPASGGYCNTANKIQDVYSRQHNPFMSFTLISKDPSRCQRLGNESALQEDIMNGDLPSFGFFSPNNYNNSHNMPLSYSGSQFSNWLDTWYYPYLEKTWKDTLVMVIFDEDNNDEGNHVAAFLMNPCLIPQTSNAELNHYSIPKFVEENWELDDLGRNDTNARTFTKIVVCGQMLIQEEEPITITVEETTNETATTQETATPTIDIETQITEHMIASMKTHEVPRSGPSHLFFFSAVCLPFFFLFTSIAVYFYVYKKQKLMTQQILDNYTGYESLTVLSHSSPLSSSQ